MSSIRAATANAGSRKDEMGIGMVGLRLDDVNGGDLDGCETDSECQEQDNDHGAASGGHERLGGMTEAVGRQDCSGSKFCSAADDGLPLVAAIAALERARGGETAVESSETAVATETTVATETAVVVEE
jgi:hypothetical protein